MSFPYESFNGGTSVDDRGRLVYINDLKLGKVKRFYVVSNHDLGTVRAWHGHWKEGKFIFVVSGAAMIGVVKISDWFQPGRDPHKLVLSADVPHMIYVPPGCAQGAKSLEPGTKIMYFSTASLAESQDDDYRWPWDYWGADFWEVKHR